MKMNMMMQGLAVKTACMVIGLDPDRPPRLDRLDEEDRVKYALIDLVTQRPHVIADIIKANPVPEHARELRGQPFRDAMESTYKKMQREVLAEAEKCPRRTVDALEMMRGFLPERFYRDPPQSESQRTGGSNLIQFDKIRSLLKH